MKQSGIYIIRNLQNKKVYIGSAIDIEKRWYCHLRRLNKECHENEHLQRAWNKYGPEVFGWKILIRCDIDNLLHYEQRAVDIYKAAIGWENLYNMSPTTGSTLGFKFSHESKAKLSELRRGKKHSPESVTQAANANRGKRRTTEQRAKMSMAHKGKKYGPHSSETKAKISAALKKYYACLAQMVEALPLRGR